MNPILGQRGCLVIDDFYKNYEGSDATKLRNRKASNSNESKMKTAKILKRKETQEANNISRKGKSPNECNIKNGKKFNMEER